MRRSATPGTVALALLFLLAPWAELKLGVGAVGIGLVASRVARGLSLDRRVVAVAAGSLLWVSYALTPFWMLPTSGGLRTTAFALTVAGILGWVRLAGTPIRWRPCGPAGAAVIVVCALLAGLNMPTLSAPLEFRGDEDFHFALPFSVLKALQGSALGANAGPWLALLLLGGLWLAWRVRMALPLSLLLAPLLFAVSFWFAPPPERLLIHLGRYPPLVSWLSTTAAFSPLHWLAPFAQQIYDEGLYRLVPALAQVSLGSWAALQMPGSTGHRILAGLAVATTPTVSYYANTTYLELIAVVLTTIGLRGAGAGIARVLAGRPDTTASLLLLSLGFMLKETFAVAALALILLAPALHAPRPRGRTWAAMARWGVLAAVVAGPLAGYICWRLWIPALRTSRPFAFDLAALVNPALYSILGEALIDQFAFLLPLAALGAAATLSRRPRRAVVWGGVAAAVLLLLSVDLVATVEGRRLPAYCGYSRYILLTFPTLACFALAGIAFLSRRAPRLTQMLLVGTVLGQLASSPLDLAGGRKAYWGDYVTETSGERYPYDALYAWLSETGIRGEIRILGRDYPYRDDFYIERYHVLGPVTAPPSRSWRSSNLGGPTPTEPERIRLTQDLEQSAREARAEVIVVHVPARLESSSFPESAGGDYAQVRRFALGSGVLLAYRRLE